MSRKLSEIGRFLKWYDGLQSDEAKQIVAAQVREHLRQEKPRAGRKPGRPKNIMIPADAQM